MRYPGVLVALAAGLMTAWSPFQAAAHQQQTTISVIAHNPRTQMLEVVHTVPLHDAEHALRMQGQRAPDILGNVESRRAFARYVAQRFSLAHGDEAIKLTLLGTQIEDGKLIVYQEGSSPGPGALLTANSQILTDVWAKQENRVNFGTGTSVETRVFHAGDGFKSALLP